MQIIKGNNKKSESVYEWSLFFLNEEYNVAFVC